MAYPPLRSMNSSLHEGATDGRYKKVRPDTECSITDDAVKNLTYETREHLSLPYYGIGEKRIVQVPGTTHEMELPDYYDNRLEEYTQRGIMGQTW